MAVGREAGTRHAGEQYERARLRLGVPRADRLDRRRIAHQDRVQPLAQQPLGELGVTPAGAHEVRQRANDGIAEALLRLEQGLRGGRETHAIAVELVQRVAPRLELGQGRFGLAARGAGIHLLLLESGDLTPRVLQRFHRAYRFLRLTRGALRHGVGPAGGRARRGLTGLPLTGGARQLLAQLGAFAFERRALAFERARRFGAPLQHFLKIADGAALRGKPAAHVVLDACARSQLALDGGEVAFGRRALGGGSLALAFGLRGAPLSLGPLLGCGLTALARVAEAFSREGEVAVEPADLELRVGESTLYFCAPCFRGVPPLHVRLPPALGISQARPGGR